MSQTTNTTNDIKIVTADPAAIGLFGLAITTFLASSAKLGWTDGLGLVIPWAILLGGLAQLYASALEAKLNNTFGMTAFGAYGFFWLAVGSCWLIQLGVFGPELQQAADASQFGLMFLGYLFLTIFLTIGALETTKVLFVDFLLIIVLFVALTLSSFGIGKAFFSAVAGWSELLIALLSFYAAGAAVLNKHLGYEFVPLGKPFGILKPAA